MSPSSTFVTRRRRHPCPRYVDCRKLPGLPCQHIRSSCGNLRDSRTARSLLSPGPTGGLDDTSANWLSRAPRARRRPNVYIVAELRGRRAMAGGRGRPGEFPRADWSLSSA
jgi:hypothetical protein